MKLSLRTHINDEIRVKTKGLNDAQVRMIKSLVKTLEIVSTSNCETEFFENSAECMRLCAALIKRSQFVTDFEGFEDIPYSHQVIEYAMELLHDQIERNEVIKFDN